MGMTYNEAKRCGLDHLWPTESKPLPGVDVPVASAVDSEEIRGKRFADFDSKLEWQFWQRLCAAASAGIFSEVDAHCVKVRAIGDASWFTVDFVTRGLDGDRVVWETKGYLREKDKLRLIGAATRYPEWAWVLATRTKGRWECRSVRTSGLSREVWTPDWLK